MAFGFADVVGDGGQGAMCPITGPAPQRTGDVQNGVPCATCKCGGDAGGGKGGVQDVCPPPGRPNIGGDGEVTVLLPVVDGSSGSGPSPLDLHYTVDLSTLPPDVIIIRAAALYHISGSSPQSATVTDDGGEASGSDPGPNVGVKIEWKQELVAELEGVRQLWPFFGPVKAHAKFNGPFGGTFLGPVGGFEVTYRDGVFG